MNSAPRTQSSARAAAGKGGVRIIGGQWRRRVLHFPAAPGLRPTPDRVRETLFNWLGQDLTGLRCLDLFAGSGALGFEALSRNAREVVMVERDARVRGALEASAAMLAAGSRARIVGGDALRFLARCSETFDLIFLDPPFGEGWVERAWSPVAAVATASAAIYVESEQAFEPPPPWHAVKSGKAGAVRYALARKSAQGTQPDE